MPRGPALLARTTGAPLVPVTLAYRGDDLEITFHEAVPHQDGRRRAGRDDAGRGRRVHRGHRRGPAGLAHDAAGLRRGPRPGVPDAAAMRIGIVCPYSFDVPGGVQNHVKDLAEALIARGHHVSVLAPERATATCRRTSSSAGRSGPGALQRVGRPGVVRAAWSAGTGPALAAARASFDVLHLHEPATPSVSLLALWAAECPVVATFHTSNVRSRAMSAVGDDPAAVAGEDHRPDRGLGVRPRRCCVNHIGGEPVVIPNGVYVDVLPGRGAARGVARRAGHGRLRRPARRAAQGLRAAGRGVRPGGRRPAGAAPAGGRRRRHRPRPRAGSPRRSASR